MDTRTDLHRIDSSSIEGKIMAGNRSLRSEVEKLVGPTRGRGACVRTIADGLEWSFGWSAPAAQRLRFLLDFGYLRHASVSTTSIYLHSDEVKRARQMSDVFAVRKRSRFDGSVLSRCQPHIRQRPQVVVAAFVSGFWGEARV
ncbi:hypothetical protein [Paraburkholderia sp. UCT2]|uniref:hypothetical protein n=1 Tax=Paraburkholderia sp. UCT2 TaxID=2615208 RepID=UPI00165673BF|nr:hypothetical protein [Paraburkholderia sp. UCT2]